MAGVGLSVTKADIDAIAGATARSVNVVFRDVVFFKAYLDTKTDGDLIALGYVQAEVDSLRSAFGDLKQLTDIFNGAATLGVAKDFKTFAKRLWGLGW